MRRRILNCQCRQIVEIISGIGGMGAGATVVSATYRFQKCHFSFAYCVRIYIVYLISFRPLHSSGATCADYLWLIFVHKFFFYRFRCHRVVVNIYRELKWHDTFPLNFCHCQSVTWHTHTNLVMIFFTFCYLLHSLCLTLERSSEGEKWHMLDMAVTNKMWNAIVFRVAIHGPACHHMIPCAKANMAFSLWWNTQSLRTNDSVSTKMLSSHEIDATPVLSINNKWNFHLWTCTRFLFWLQKKIHTK